MSDEDELTLTVTTGCTDITVTLDTASTGDNPAGLREPRRRTRRDTRAALETRGLLHRVALYEGYGHL